MKGSGSRGVKCRGTPAAVSQFIHYGNYLIWGAVVLAHLERERMSRIRRGNIKGEDGIQEELFIKGIRVIFR